MLHGIFYYWVTYGGLGGRSTLLVTRFYPVPSVFAWLPPILSNTERGG